MFCNEKVLKLNVCSDDGSQRVVRRHYMHRRTVTLRRVVFYTAAYDDFSQCSCVRMTGIYTDGIT